MKLEPELPTNLGTLYKAISVARLADILSHLPEGSLIAPNSLGELVVLDKDKNYLGHVAVMAEEYCAV